MDSITHTLGAEERTLAASLAGRKVVRVGGYRLGVFDDCVFHQVARIVFSGGSSFDLRNRFGTLRLPNGLTEDIGTLSLGPAEGDVWLPEGAAISKLAIGETVRRVAIVDDEDGISRDGQAVTTVSFTQAVVFELESGLLVLDKGEWTDDYVCVRQGNGLDALLTDCSTPWVEGDGWSDAYQRKVSWL